jgi:hypothetical protein
MTPLQQAIICILYANTHKYPVCGMDGYGYKAEAEPHIYSFNNRCTGFTIAVPYLGNYGFIHTERCSFSTSTSRDFYPSLWRLEGKAMLIKDMIDVSANDVTRRLYDEIQIVIEFLKSRNMQEHGECYETYLNRYGKSVGSIIDEHLVKLEYRCAQNIKSSVDRHFGLTDSKVKKSIEKETGIPVKKQPKHLIESWLLHKKIKHEIKKIKTNEKYI